jgi:hypothetical protein
VSREEEKKKSKSVDAESFESGRVFALLKRRDPSLYEEVVSIMESENKDPSDVIYEAFALYRDYKYMVGVDPRALAYAIRVVQVFQQRAIELMAFSIEYFSKLMGAGPEQVAETVARRLSEELKSMKEAEKEEKGAGIPRNVRERLMELTATTMMKMVEAMFSLMPKPGATPALTQAPTTGQEQKTERKPKIVTGTPPSTGEKKEKAGDTGTQQ